MKSSRLQQALARIDANRKRASEASRTTVTSASIPLIQINGAANHDNRQRNGDISQTNSNVESTIHTPNTSELGSNALLKRSNITGNKESEEWLNPDQLLACESIIAGKSIALIGKAGTGKTTDIRETVRRLIELSRIPFLRNIDGHKHLKVGFAGIVCCAFTNRATNNIAKGFDLATTPIHFITVHKLLEYRKEEFYVIDKVSGLEKKSFRFTPNRTRYNPLPSGIKLIILEESSQINKSDLHAKLLDACYGRSIQFVYLGDLQQLPPIGGDGILGYKINELPTIELKQIYRQAYDNPIIRLAWEIASGATLGRKYITETYSPVKDITKPIQINFWERKIDWESANIAMGKWITTQIDADIFNWERNDIILMPYNKQFGTIELNKAIAQHLSMKAERETYEIIAGFQRHYFSVGDKVLYAKKEGIITKIMRNGRYIGRTPLPPAIELTRDGTYSVRAGTLVTTDVKSSEIENHGMSDEELDRYLDNLTQTADEEVINQASHIMKIRLLYEQMPDGTEEVEISTRGEYGECEFGYAISIHKSQGSEWRKVFLILHHSHHQLSREMLYTAVTRASQQLFIIAEPDSFVKAVSRQRIPGNTLEEKKQWFLNKMQSAPTDAEKEIEEDE